MNVGQAPLSSVLAAGVRVDLAEVEAALRQHPAVADAATRLWQVPAQSELAAAGPVLAAYAELAAEQSRPSPSKLQQWCRQQLPSAAVPQHVFVLPQLPRSVAGKVERSRLPSPLAATAAAAGTEPIAAAAATETEAAAPEPPGRPGKRRRAAASEAEVACAFAAALGHRQFEATSNLFAVGGNSLTAAQIAGELAGGDVAAVFQHPTVRSLAAYLSSSTASVAGPSAQGAPSQQLQPAAPGSLVAARALAVDGSSGGSGGGAGASGPLRLAWRAKMLQCVDAAPVFEQPRPAVPSGGHQAYATAAGTAHGRLFACSHGGDVACHAAASGACLWQTVLSDQADAGLALCRPVLAGSARGELEQLYIAVPTNSGSLHFLDATTGGITGTVECGGGCRAPPSVDSWCGLVWQPTHGRQLVVAAAPGGVVWRLPLPAAASAAVTFDAEQQAALVCCLDGSLLAIDASADRLAAAAESRSVDSSTDSGPQLQVAWQHQCGAPLFAPAAPLAGGSVAAAAVDGSVTCLRSRDGSQLWRTSVKAAVFAPMLALPPSGPQQQGQRLLISTQTGALVALSADSGQQLAAAQLGAKVTGLQLLALPTAPAGAASAAPPRAAEDAARQRRQRRHLVLATLAPGTVVLLDPAALLEGSGSHVLDAVQLPGDTFAAATALPLEGGSGGGSGVGGGAALVAVGCRDDHLYCLCLQRPD